MRIGLVNPPFASLRRPALGLYQLGHVARSIGHEVTHLELTHAVAMQGRLSAYLAAAEMKADGLGDWFFARRAFGKSPRDDDYLHSLRWAVTAKARARLEEPGGREQLVEELQNDRQLLEQSLDACLEALDFTIFDVVGIVSMFSQNTAAIHIANWVKAHSPSTYVVLGGANCEYPMGASLVENCLEVDFVFSGPSLVSFPTWLGHLEAGRLDDLHTVDGVLSRRNRVKREAEGLQIGSPSQPTISPYGPRNSIDEIPLVLDYTPFLSSLHRWLPGAAPVIPFETSRGCWWGARRHCTFCGLNGSSMKFDELPVEAAGEQLTSLMAAYPTVHKFDAVDNIMPQSYVRSLNDYLKPRADVQLFWEIKANVSERQLATLRSSAVVALQPGIEALDTPRLQLLKKGTTAFQNIKFLKACTKIGIDAAWNLLFGMPDEPNLPATVESYRRFLPRLVHIQPPNAVCSIRFDRFSPYFNEAATYGLDLAPPSFYHEIYPFSPESVSQLAYWFEDRGDTAPRDAVIDTIRPVTSLVTEWKRSWESDAVPALRGTGLSLLDSRSGVPTVHSLTEAERAALFMLERPRSLETLQRSFSDADSLLSKFMSHDLLFEESGHFLSLVIWSDYVDEEPAD